MKKLTLSLDDLQVESFGTTIVPDSRGTVRGNSGCCYTDYNCTEAWSTCGGGDDTNNYCPVTGMVSCGDTACSCSTAVQTCAPDCPLSYHTDCHRC